MSLATSFKTFMGKSLVQSLALGMGETVTLNGNDYSAIVQMDEAGTERGARGGRRTILLGQVTMQLTDWTAASGSEGMQITLPDGVARISTKPTLTESTAQFMVEWTGA